MTFLEKLQSRKGGLIKLKTELYWYTDQLQDKNPGRICLLLDVVKDVQHLDLTTVAAARTASRAGGRSGGVGTTAIAHLLIDGSPQWVWVAEADVEPLNESR